VRDIAARDPRVRYHCHASNIGSLANFQFGLRSVDTPHFSFLSDDDYLLPGFFEHAAAALDAHPDAAFFAGLTLRCDESGQLFDAKLEQWPREGVFVPPEGVLQMLHGMAPCWTGVVFRRELAAELGGIDVDVGGASDLDFLLRAAARWPYIVSRHPSAVFMIHAGSFGQTQPLSAFWPGWRRMIENLERSPGLDVATRDAMREGLHADMRRLLLRRSADALRRGDLQFARDAGDVLAQEYGRRAQRALLRGLAAVLAHVPLTQRAYAMAYGGAERLLLTRRGRARIAHPAD